MRYRERTSIIEDMINAPCWLNVLILIFGNIVIRFILPEFFTSETPKSSAGVMLTGGIANATPIIANLFSMVVGFAVLFSGFRELTKRHKG